MNILKENKAILIIVIIIVVILAWSGMSNTSGGSSLLSQQRPSTDKSVNDRELLQLLTDMRSIRLEGHIFESPSYLSLQDFGRNIIPEQVGRVDPFAPLPKTEITITGGGDLKDQVLLR